MHLARFVEFIEVRFPHSMTVCSYIQTQYPCSEAQSNLLQAQVQGELNLGIIGSLFLNIRYAEVR